MTKNRHILYSILLLIIIGGILFVSGSYDRETKKMENLDKKLFPDVTEKFYIKQKHITSISDIEPVTGNKVKPIDYLNSISLAGLPLKEKKQYFINLILPAVLIAKEEYKERLEWVNEISKKSALSDEENTKLGNLLKTYKAKNIEDLKTRLVTHPTSIVLAQASIESGGVHHAFLLRQIIFSEFGLLTLKTREYQHLVTETEKNVFI